jgi:hypothetical protein
MPNIAVARDRAEVDASHLTWMAVHGVLCLGLRHPNMQRVGEHAQVRELVEQFVRGLEKIMLDGRFLSEAEIADVHRVEAEERATPPLRMIDQDDVASIALGAGALRMVAEIFRATGRDNPLIRRVSDSLARIAGAVVEPEGLEEAIELPPLAPRG